LSPKVGVALEVGELVTGDRPEDGIRSAVRLADAQGLRVSPADEHGVARHHITGRWFVTTRRHPRAVSVLAAVCLAYQPEDGTEVEEGAAAALDVQADWIRGVLDGWDNDGAASGTGLRGRALERYRDGVREGHLVYAEMHRRCGGCGRWRYHRDVACAKCVAPR
jgi:hypothetical protein